MSRRNGFTLLELLVSIAVIVLLVSLIFPAFYSARRSSSAARELSAARQLMFAYRSYAYDHKGILMPGFYNLDGTRLPAHDEAGTVLSGPLAARYPWRLAPYLDYNLSGLYLDKELFNEFRQPGDDW